MRLTSLTAVQLCIYSNNNNSNNTATAFYLCASFPFCWLNHFNMPASFCFSTLLLKIKETENYKTEQFEQISFRNNNKSAYLCANRVDTASFSLELHHSLQYMHKLSTAINVFFIYVLQFTWPCSAHVDWIYGVESRVRKMKFRVFRDLLILIGMISDLVGICYVFFSRSIAY